MSEIKGQTARETGYAAEALAANFLENEGFSILAANYTIRGAEIDLIARDADCIVFVEVKYRKSSYFGTPGAQVTRTKQARICRAALAWLAQNALPDVPVRFDVVEVTPMGCKLLRAAFSYIEG